MADGKTTGLHVAVIGEGFWRAAAGVNLPQRLVLLGSDGALELQADNSIVLKRRGAADEACAAPASSGDPYGAALTAWLSEVTGAVRERRQIAPSFADGVATAEVMDRLRQSFRRA